MTVQVAAGFKTMYRHIQSHGLALHHFDGTRPRVLLRTSHLYQDAIERSFEPAALASREARMVPLEQLVAARPDAVSERGDAPRRVAEIELESMERLQVPRFTVDARRNDLFGNGIAIGPVFDETPMARAERSLSSLEDVAMVQECKAIEDSILHAARNDFPVPPLHLNLMSATALV